MTTSQPDVRWVHCLFNLLELRVLLLGGGAGIATGVCHDGSGGFLVVLAALHDIVDCFFK